MNPTSQQETAVSGGGALPLGAPPFNEFRRGWKVLVLSSLGVFTSVTAAMLYAFGSFIIPLQQAFGWSRSDVQTTMSFFFAGAILATSVVGWLNLKFGLRRVAIVSLMLLSLGYLAFLLLPQGASIIWLYIGFALLPIIGVGSMPITWTQMIGNWFVRSRGLALAAALSGTGFAAALIPTLVTWAMGRWGWQAGFILLALPVGLLALPLSLLWLKPMPPVNPSAAARNTAELNVLAGIPFKDALLSGKFWLCNLALVMVVSAVICMVTSTIPILRDKGLSAIEASSVFGAYGVALMGGRMVVGYLLDRVWAPGVAALTLALPAVGCLIFTTSETSMPVLMLASGLMGIGAGAEFDLSSYLLARYFGMRDYGRLYGLHLSFINVLAALSPLIIKGLFKISGDYSLMLMYCITVFFSGAVALLFLGRYPKFDSPAALTS